MAASNKREPRNISVVDPQSFGGRLRHYRDEAGLSQIALGEMVCLPQARISSYERNQNMPGEDIILMLAEAVNAPPSEFFEGTQFAGVLVVGSERRKRLLQLSIPDWQVIDPIINLLREGNPQQRKLLMQTLQGITGLLQGNRSIESFPEDPST